MKSVVFRVALFALFPFHLLAQDVPIKLIEPELGKELGFISCKFEAKPKADQVMVILAESTELDGSKSALEHVLVSSGVAVSFTITLIDVEATNPDVKAAYVVVQNGARNFLRNVRMTNSSSGPGNLEFKFADGQMHKTSLARSWKIRLEKYESVRARHPDLPAPPKLDGWRGSVFLVPAS